jgi:hypothetical protein
MTAENVTVSYTSAAAANIRPPRRISAVPAQRDVDLPGRRFRRVDADDHGPGFGRQRTGTGRGFTVTLSEASGEALITTATAEGLILNDDVALSIAPADAVKFEGHTGTTEFTFTVTREGLHGPAVRPLPMRLPAAAPIRLMPTISAARCPAGKSHSHPAKRSGRSRLRSAAIPRSSRTKVSRSHCRIRPRIRSDHRSVGRRHDPERRCGAANRRELTR